MAEFPEVIVPKGPKFKFLLVGLIAFLVFAIWFCLKSTTPESEFKEFFADLSIAAPEYQALHDFSRPLDAVKGDYFTANFQQSEKQFHDFLARIKASQQAVTSIDGDWITADSKINPKYPWMLNIQAEATDSKINRKYPWMLDVQAQAAGSTNKSYEVHMEGRQPYD